MTWTTLFGFVVLVPFSAWELWTASAEFTLRAVAACAYLGIGVTVIGLYLWLGILQSVPAPIAAGVQFLQPVIGVVSSMLLLGELATVTFVIAVALVLGGLALTLPKLR